MSEMKEAETKRDAIEERLRGDLRPHERYEFQEFLDSFADDIIVELVRQFGGWNSRQTYGQVLAVLRRMIEAWQAGRERLREDIQEI